MLSQGSRYSVIKLACADVVGLEFGDLRREILEPKSCDQVENSALVRDTLGILAIIFGWAAV